MKKRLKEGWLEINVVQQRQVGGRENKGAEESKRRER
jgi:hypothetical protein